MWNNILIFDIHNAFYLFFESKEALFCEVLCSMQEQICNAASEIIEKHQDKYGVAEALKLIYREYDKNIFKLRYRMIWANS